MALVHAAGEHALEVGTRGRQHVSVAGEEARPRAGPAAGVTTSMVTSQRSRIVEGLELGQQSCRMACVLQLLRASEKAETVGL